MEEKRILICRHCEKKFVGDIVNCPLCGEKLVDGGPVPEAYLNRMNQAKRQGAAAPQRKTMESAGERRAAREANSRGFAQSVTLKILTVVCIAVMVLLAVVAGKTQIFVEDDSDKTVLFSSMKKDDIASVQNYINNYSALFENGYDSNCISFDNFLAMLKPTSEGGLYRGFFDEVQLRTDGADPAQRFSASENTAGYVALEKANVQKIAKSMGLTALKDINSKSCYFYNDNYYFAIPVQSEETQKLYAVVTKTKETSSGDFYCVCDVYSSPSALTSTDGLTPVFTRYMLLGAKESEKGISWKLKIVSDKELYSSTGKRIESESSEGKLDYQIKRKTLVAKTSDGKEFARYYIEYPVFKNSGMAQAACESVYKGKISEFKSRVKNADGLYKAFRDDGGKDSMLPIYSNVVVSVTYNKDGYFSIVEKYTDFNPSEKTKPTTTTATSGSYYSYNTTEATTLDYDTLPVSETLPVSVYEGVTFDIESGEFVKKDELVGTDYASVLPKLYSLYTGQATPPATPAIDNSTEGGYSNYMATEQSNNNSIDTDSVGSDIYNSAWAVDENGMNFYYQPASGLEVVTIPWSELTARTAMMEVNS